MSSTTSNNNLGGTHAAGGVAAPVTTCAAQAAASHIAQVRQGQSSPAFQDPHLPQHQQNPDEWGDIPQVVDARPILPLAAFYMGDLRDGLPMVSTGIRLAARMWT